MREGSIDWVGDTNRVHRYPLLHTPRAFFQVIPISIAVLIKSIHIVHPLIGSLLREDGILMQLFTDDLLAEFILIVLVIVAAEGFEVAIFTTAVRTLHRMVH